MAVKMPPYLIPVAVRQGCIPADWDSLPAKRAAKRKGPVADAMRRPVSRERMEFEIPCRIISEANKHEHWRRTKARKDAQKQAVAIVTAYKDRPALPCIVTLIRHGWQKQDDDNLRRSFKTIRDALAAWIGADDGSDEIEWRYHDCYARPAVWVKIQPRTP